MPSRTAVCSKYLKHLVPMEHIDAYWCESCQETVTLRALLIDSDASHRLLFPHKKVSLWPEETEELRGAVSVPDERAGGVTVCRANGDE